MSRSNGRKVGAGMDAGQSDVGDGTAHSCDDGLDAGRMLTEREVAALLGCAPITIRRERLRGHIAYQRYSRKRIRYFPEDVRAYQRSCRVDVNEAPKPTSSSVATHSRSISGGNVRSIAADRAAAQAILNRRQRS